jgi:hypothetical protein
MKMKLAVTAVAVIASIAVLGAFGPLQAAPAVKCDRECLVKTMKDYLAALVKHDPSAMEISVHAKFVENTANIPVGDGLWRTASGGPGEFQIYAADPVAQQVACLVMMKENNNQDIILGARLKLMGDTIMEAEHLVIRDDISEASLANLQKPRPALLEDLAPADRTPRDEMLAAGLAYYDALTGEDGTLAPFADDCERRENGMTTAGTRQKLQPIPGSEGDPEMQEMMKAMAAMPRTCEGQISTGTFAYITEILSRRVFIADEKKGLVVGFSMFYHRGIPKIMKIKTPAGVRERPNTWGVFNLPAMHIYKIKKGKIFEIEAIGFVLPYGTKSGWE